MITRYTILDLWINIHHEIIISTTLMWVMIRNIISLFLVPMEALSDVSSVGITCIAPERVCVDLILVLSPRGIILSLMERMVEGWAFAILPRMIALEVDVATS